MIFILTAILSLILIDVLIKAYIEKKESSFFPKKILRGKIKLHKSFNGGMMMGLGAKYPLIVKWIPALLIPIMIIYYFPFFNKRGSILMKLSGIFALSGGIGNLTDRLIKGKVTDYFSLPFKKISHIIFNLSDMFIFLGGFLLILAEVLKDLPWRSS